MFWRVQFDLCVGRSRSGRGRVCDVVGHLFCFISF